MSLPPLEPVLARQLRKEGVTDRVRLSRSLETSTEEMTALHGRLEEERQRLRSLVLAFADALSVFRNAIPQRFSDQSVDEATSAVSQTKLKFSGRLREIIAAGGAPGGSTSTEFEALGRDLLALADQLVRLLRDTAEKASLKKELEVAGAVQQMLLPERDLIERPYAKMAACYRPAAECSGDWWAAHDLVDGRFLVVLGDVTGHGIASAILTGAAKAACDLIPYLVRGQGERCEMMTVVSHGAPLGATRDSVYTSQHVRLEPGDVLLWYTDGLVECEDARGEQFGEKRLRATLQHASRWHAPAIRDSLVHAITRFMGNHHQKDDITFVVARLGT
jgi:hypothetical protein